MSAQNALWLKASICLTIWVALKVAQSCGKSGDVLSEINDTDSGTGPGGASAGDADGDTDSDGDADTDVDTDVDTDACGAQELGASQHLPHEHPY